MLSPNSISGMAQLRLDRSDPMHDAYDDKEEALEGFYDALAISGMVPTVHGRCKVAEFIAQPTGYSADVLMTLCQEALRTPHPNMVDEHNAVVARMVRSYVESVAEDYAAAHSKEWAA